MIRIREILDPDLKKRIIAALADRRGMSPAAIPEWYELDDADFVDLLNELKQAGIHAIQHDDDLGTIPRIGL